MEIFKDWRLEESPDEPIIVLQLNQNLTEFSDEFLVNEPEKRVSIQQRAKNFVNKNLPHLKKATVKIMFGTMLISSFAFQPTQEVYAHETDFNMSYLYFGGSSSYYKQIESTKGNLKVASPSYFDLNPDGSLKLTWQLDPNFIKNMQSQGIKIVPFLSNHWDRTIGRAALENRESLSTEIANVIEKYNLDGINVDIENVTDADRDNYTDLVRLLREKIPAEKEVSVAVAANPNNWQKGWHGSYDYNQLAKYSDYLMIMAYDESYQNGPEGPVASLPWVKRSIEYAINQGVPNDKIVLGIPFYGRYWQEGKSSGGYGISNSRVEEMIEKYESTVVYDEKAQSPKAIIKIKETDEPFTFSSTTLGPGTYHIWYEDERSIEAKVDLVHEYEIKGTGSWSLGQEDTDIWTNYSNWLKGHNNLPNIQPVEEEPTETIATTTLYTVASGDTLFKIANKFATTVESIKSLNNLTSDTIYVGQKLNVPTISSPIKEVQEEETNKFGSYFEVTSDDTPVYDNSSGKLIEMGTLNKGEVYERVSDYGNWHRIKFGDKFGYVHKDATKPSTGNEITGENRSYQNSDITFEATENLTVYDNSTGSLVPFATILKGGKYPIISDYGNWYRIILSGKVGYVHKSGVKVEQKFGKYFEVTVDDVPIYDNSTGKLVEMGTLEQGEVYERVSDYGNWHRIKFGDKYGYVHKDATKPSTGNEITGENRSYQNSDITFEATENLTVYDNSSGSLVPIASILKGGKYPIVSDYGNWYRIILSGKVGYVHKSGAKVERNFGKYFEVTTDVVPVYDNSTGKLVEMGTLEQGEEYERVSDYGNWHRIKFGDKYGYVHKDATKPSTGNEITGENRSYQNSDVIFEATENLTVYDNSSGSLVPFATILKGGKYPIVSDYGNWYRIILSGKVGYVHKSGVKL
ncbi:glycosyl hydrolase family 18 protein [Salinibacillus xinjiangensis]|uniref:LysM peptidoglycan-binding domain-containing protein n=1 Tax=Salinibacillus xinjiangensis TaxID=1229268 RepID=A0A6G1X2G5_9BACI|nr:glycosyl hydrolase family 18 protein [Salinibacillus xinjiangensis]MRG85090.1 LysM peptidoglycan-binding domain-containing protein [Salinibacillus xinjiangensis]